MVHAPKRWLNCQQPKLAIVYWLELSNKYLSSLLMSSLKSEYILSI